MTSKSIRSKSKSKTKSKSKSASVKSTKKSGETTASSVLFPLAFFGSLFAGGVYMATREYPVYPKTEIVPRETPVDPNAKDVDLRAIVKKSKQIANTEEKNVMEKYIKYPKEITETLGYVKGDMFKKNITTEYNTGIIKQKIEDNKYDAKKGFVFYGPSGTGKTYLAQNICNEYNMIMFDINSDIIMGHPGTEVIMFRSIFTAAEKIVKNGGKCLIFFDELDGILHSKLKSTTGGGEARKQELTNEFQKLSGSIRENVFVIGTTNLKEYEIDEPIKMRLISISINELTKAQKLDRYNNVLKELLVDDTKVNEFETYLSSISVIKNNLTDVHEPAIFNHFKNEFEGILEICTQSGTTNYGRLFEKMEENKVIDVKFYTNYIKDNFITKLTDLESYYTKFYDHQFKYYISRLNPNETDIYKKLNNACENISSVLYNLKFYPLKGILDIHKLIVELQLIINIAKISKQNKAELNNFLNYTDGVVNQLNNSYNQLDNYIVYKIDLLSDSKNSPYYRAKLLSEISNLYANKIVSNLKSINNTDRITGSELLEYYVVSKNINMRSLKFSLEEIILNRGKPEIMTKIITGNLYGKRKNKTIRSKKKKLKRKSLKRRSLKRD